MKYKKGTFVIVPNLDELKGKPSEMQAIYLWICSHADKDGVCFPTKSTIEKEAGCSHNTVSKYLKQLVEDGFLDVKERTTKNGRNTSNEYQLLILEGIPTKNGIDHPTKNGSQTISISNYTHLTKDTTKVEAPFNLEEELIKLESSSWKPNKILALYLRFTGMKFENKKQFEAEVAKNRRGAISLDGYNSRQIIATMEYCEKNYKDVGWNLYTVNKRIGLIINNKIN